MKAKLIEYEGCIAIDFEAETLQEAATITRAGMNTTKQLRYSKASVTKDGAFGFCVVIEKHRRADSYVPKRK